MYSFTLNKDEAMAGSGGSARIDSTGKYKGTITFAKIYTVDSGAEFVQLAFETDAGQTTRLSLCTKGKDTEKGKATFGTKRLQAIMTCAQVKELKAVEKEVEDYDYELGKVAKVKRHVFPDLMGKRIGFLLVRHDKTSAGGKDFFEMEIEAPFNYDTEQTALEVWEKKQPEALPKILANMKDKDSRKQGYGSGHDAYSAYAASSSMQAPAGLAEDDLPF